jgi:chromosome segregation ATPase
MATLRSTLLGLEVSLEGERQRAYALRQRAGQESEARAKQAQHAQRLGERLVAERARRRAAEAQAQAAQDQARGAASRAVELADNAAEARRGGDAAVAGLAAARAECAGLRQQSAELQRELAGCRKALESGEQLLLMAVFHEGCVVLVTCEPRACAMVQHRRLPSL